MLWLLCHALLFVKKLNNFKPLKLGRKIFFVFVGGLSLAFDKRVIIYDIIFFKVMICIKRFPLWPMVLITTITKMGCNLLA